MKSKILIILALFSLALSGCSLFPPNEQKSSISAQINQALNAGAAIKEIANPNLKIPADINAGQIAKYFQIGNVLFALVLRNSMNVVLSTPSGFTPSFAGILIAKQGDKQWIKLTEIKDSKVTDKNNPYYLLVDNKKLLLTVVDQNGAGSGEGMMKVFAWSAANDWQLAGCYYFGSSFSDQSTDGDYFAWSTKFSEQEARPIEACDNVRLISVANSLSQ
ncbi:MAG: hypothetical protein PHE24_04175 [Patescibacteria group bacterium]|nr:hypothetical protein [Patescibacteria group bacterium]